VDVDDDAKPPLDVTPEEDVDTAPVDDAPDDPADDAPFVAMADALVLTSEELPEEGMTPPEELDGSTKPPDEEPSGREPKVQ
jgi:hypothetical protein